MKYFSSTLLFLLSFFTTSLFAQIHPSVNAKVDSESAEPENLNVLHDWIRWSNPGSMKSKYLAGLASKLFEDRNKEISKLVTRQDWQNRQTKMKIKLRDAMGTFPIKTPLNAKVTGVIQKQGYRIEKIIFESWQGFYVTGCLFIPDIINGKLPGVLNLIGHEQESFHAPLDQVIIQNLVKKGMIVLPSETLPASRR